MSKLFAHRRNYLYQRAHDTGTLPGGQSASNSQSGDINGNPSTPAVDTPATSPKTTISLNPFTSILQLPTQSSTTPPAVTTPTSQPPTPATSSSSSPPSPSQAPTQVTSAAMTSPSATSSSSSTPSIPSSVILSTSSLTVASFTTELPTDVSLSPMSTASPSASSSAGSGSSGGAKTGVVIGAIAAAIVGIAVIGFFVMWCLRRQRDKEFDDFDAQAFKRQSAVLVDDPAEPSRSFDPRPPSMIERHNASPALAAQTAYGGQNFYGGYGGFGQQQSFAPDMNQPIGSPPPQAYGAQPMGYAGYSDPQPSVHAVYDGRQQLARHPSNATYLTRQPSSVAPYGVPPASHDTSAQCSNVSRASVTPYQAAQYADISRQLGTTDPNTHENVELPDGPLPSPFDDPVDMNPPANYHAPPTAAPGPVAASAVPRAQGNAFQSHRPTTEYEEGDAYGGI